MTDQAIVNELNRIQGQATDVLNGVKRRLEVVEGLLTRPTGFESAGDNTRLATKLWDSASFADFKRVGGKGRLIYPVQGGFFDHETKTTITSATVGSSTPGILVPSRIPGIVKPGVQSFRVRDLMPRFPTTNNAVEWVKENAFTNTASPTAETISKPESALTFTIDSSTVKTIAHWIPASKQVLDDFASLQMYLDLRLIEGLKDVEDYELIGGDGTGQHLSGLTIEATAYDTARNVSGDTYIDKLNHAISQVIESKFQPSGVVLNPRDWFACQLIKDQASNVGGYVLGGPGKIAEPFLWGIPVATTTAVPVGQFFVGSFGTHCMIVDRQDAVVEVSDSHADYFVRNMVAIRAEERIAFVVTRGDAFVHGDF